MSKIKALIFDLGGVILDIDQDKTIRAFNRLGLDLEALHYQMPVLNHFETGKITIEEFRQVIKTAIKRQVEDAQINDAWNCMLLELPKERLRILNKFKQKYQLYLLSNTNALHMQCFYNYLERTHGIETWHKTFDRIFYSYEIGLRKPDKSCYEFVCNTIGLAPEQCLFIDDSLLNIRGAEAAGIRTCHAKTTLDIELANQIIAASRTSKPEYN